MRLGWLACVALPALCAAAPPDARDIVRRSVENTRADWHAAPQYNFTERDVTKNGQTKTYRVMMIEGSPYNKLIAVNGKPLAGTSAAEEERKLEREIASRRHESPAQRRKRVAQYQKERRQDNALMEEMVNAFDFHLAGEETVHGRQCFVLNSTPKPGYRPTSRETKVLTGMRGKMWIDKGEYQWVKVEAEVFRPVPFGLFIANVEPGTRFLLEQEPVNGKVWLPSHFSVRVNARVLRFWSHNSTDDETYSNYRLASLDKPLTTTARR